MGGWPQGLSSANMRRESDTMGFRDTRGALAMHLFDYLDSGNGYKVRLLLAQLGLPYEWTEVDIDAGETRTPEFLRRNPNGRIPTLELDDGTNLAESNAILWYLAEGTQFVPRSARACAGSAVDVLRAIQPRAVRGHAAVHREAPAREPSAPRGAARALGQGRAALAVMERTSQRAGTSSPRSTASRISRCTRTRTWRTRAATTSRRTRTSTRG